MKKKTSQFLDMFWNSGHCASNKCIYGKSLGVGTIRSVWASKCTYLFRQKPLGQELHTVGFFKNHYSDKVITINCVSINAKYC